jgi:hypothetical protein
VQEVRSQLKQEKADRQEAERELEEECKARQNADRKLDELQENSEIDFDFAGKAGELVSWLRKTVGKALPKQVTVKEVQKILESKDNCWGGVTHLAKN